MIPRGAKRLKYSSATTKVYFHGNSIIAGVGVSAGQDPSSVMGTMAPLAAAGVTVTALGHSANTWEQLTALTDADSAFAAGKTNVLLAMETINSLSNAHDSVNATIAAARAYCAARLAAHPTVKLVLVTGTSRWPTDAYWTSADLGAAIVAVNQAMVANYRAWGAVACVDLRAPGSPWNAFSTYSAAEYAATGLYTGDNVHPNAAGAALIARMCANTLFRLAA
jgi:lysophospholipase L1-like esterase